MKEEQTENKVNKDWRKMKLGEVANYVNGKAFKPSEWSTEGLPIIRIQNLNREKSLFNYCNFEVDKKFLVRKGDLLFAWSGTPDTSFGAHIWKGEEAVLNQHIFRIEIDKNKIDKKFYLYALNNKVKEFVSKAHGTAGLAHITKKKFEDAEILVPPIAKQQQIVSKIEELFSELDKGIEEIKTAQQQLKVYRQAVLKWAFEGKLTNGNVKDGELPEGWKWVKLNEVSKKITDGEHFRPKTQEKGVPFLSAKDVRHNGVSFDEPLFISEETAKKALLRCNPKRGDILIVSRGATVGRMCIVKTDKVFCLLGSVILVKPKNELSNDFLTYILKSPQSNRKLISISGATAQQAIYLRDIKEVPLPLPTLEEQHQIVREIESRLSVCDKIEETITASLKQAEALRQSILKKAFEGKLIVKY